MEISIKEKIVSAIQLGLSDAKTEIYSSNTVTDNRKHMEKWDKINDRIVKLFSEDKMISTVLLDRGFFKLILIYDNEKKIIYTIIRKNNFSNLLSRHSVSKAHYIDALLGYNYSYQIPNQISLLESGNLFSETAEKQIGDLQNKIETLVSADEIKQYISIVIDFNGYTLNDINAVLCSNYLEIIETESLAEYIIPSFGDVEEKENWNSVYEDDLRSKISIKPTIKKETNIG